MNTCPKHGEALKTWPSGDQYCPHLDPTGRQAKNGKKYCTYILKAVQAEEERQKPTQATQNARVANNDARVAACLMFAGRVFQGQGADQAVNALEFAKMALSLYE